MVTSDTGGREVKMNKPHPDPLLKEREQERTTLGVLPPYRSDRESSARRRAGRGGSNGR